MKKRSTYKLFKKSAWLAWLLVLSVACSANHTQLEEGKLHVVTSFYPLYDFTRKIGGEHVQVINLVPAGVDAHDWAPKSRDIVHMSEADLFIYNGLGFEGWLDDFLDSLHAEAKVTPVRATALLEPIVLGHKKEEEEGDHDHDDHHDHHDHGDYDPHAWISPKSAKKMAEQILQSLVNIDPDHADTYLTNYEQLAAQLDELDEELRAIIAAGNRQDIVVSHDAYRYLERDYGLKQIAVMGINPESEPTPQDMKHIAQYVKEHQVPYILFEELASPRIADILAKEAGVETLVFTPVEGLTEEQLQAGEDYFSVMKRNLTSLEKTLQ